MAWQGYKDIQTSKYPHMALDLDVWDVVHSGDTLTFKATVRAKVTSGNLHYNGVSVSLTGGGSISRNMNPVSTGQSVDFGTFSCSIGVPASTTSCDVTASLNAGTVASGSARWTLTFGQGGSAPSGGYVSSLTSTWNSVTGTYGITSDGGSTLTNLIFKVLKAPYAAGVPAREYRATVPGDMSLNPRTRTVDNSSNTENNPTWTFKGCDLYYAGIYASNSIGEYRYQDGSVYTPPAPGQLSYQEPESGTSYTINYVGVPANNNPDYDPSWLTRTVRYKVGSGDWTYIENDSVVALDVATVSTISIPASSSAIVEAWMTYHGAQSTVSSVTIVNSNSPVNAYCSVNDEAVLVDKIYGSVNSATAKIVKAYASHEGVARKVFEDV